MIGCKSQMDYLQHQLSIFDEHIRLLVRLKLVVAESTTALLDHPYILRTAEG